MSEAKTSGVICTSLSADRQICTDEVHNSVTSSQDQFYPSSSANDNSSKLFTTQECKEADQRSYVTYHRQEETGGLIQTSISPNKNHVTAISVNSPRDVLKSFHRELGNQDTTKQNIHTRSTSVRIDDSHLNDNHYSNQHGEVPHLKLAGRYENADSDTETPLQYHRPLSGEHQSSRRFYSDAGRVFETRHENVDPKMRKHATRGEYLLPRHHSLDLSKRIYFTKKQKQPQFPSKGDYVYGHSKKHHPQTSSRAFYPIADHYSDTEAIIDLDYSSFDVLSVASSSDSDVFVTVESSDDNRKKTKYQDIFAKRYTVLSERDFTKEIPIYSHKHNRRHLTPTNRRHSTSRDRRRSHSRPRQIILSRHSRGSAASDDDYDDDDGNSGITFYTRRSSNRQRQKELDIFSLNRNGASPAKPTSLDQFSTMPYSLSTIPQGALNSNFSLYPYTGLSPTFQSAYVGFPFSATPTHTNHLIGNNTLDFAAVRNYLGAMSASLASIPPPTIGTTPYISQQILQSTIPDTPESLGTQELFTNDNHNYNSRSTEGQVVYRNVIEMKPSDSGASFNEGQCLPVSPSSRVTDVLPSSTVGHTQGRGIDDSHGKTQGKLCNPDTHSKTVSELNPISSHANINTERSRLRSISEIPTAFSGSAGKKTEKNSANCEITDENKYKFSAMQRKVSQELSARFLSNVNSTEKRLNMSPVQSNSDQLKSSHNINSTLQSAPAESGVVTSVSDTDRRPLKRSVTIDSHNQTPKSPPPVTFPKQKSAGEKLISPVSPTPLQQPAFSDSSNKQITSLAAANVSHISTDDLSHSLGSNFFEISELEVIHIPENVSQDVNHVAKNDKLARNSKESSLLPERAGEKYSITQLYSPQISTLQAHPEADYDVYPRRSTNDTLPSRQQEKSTIFNGNNLPLVSPTKVRRESLKSLQQNNNNMVRKIINNFSRNTEVPLKHNSTSSTSHESPLGLSESRQKTSSNGFIPRRFPTDKVIADSRSFQSPARRDTLKSNPGLVESTEEARRSSYKSPNVYTSLAHSAKSEQDRFNTNTQVSSHYVKLNDTNTDLNDTSYQFYTGPVSLQPKSNNTSNVTLKNVSDSQARNVFDESFHNNTQKLRSDSISTKYIFYKGSKVTPASIEESMNPLLNKSQQIPYDPNEDPLIANSQRVQQISPGSKSRREGVDFHPESDKQKDKDVVRHRSIKTEVPIPPRDFDSEADSCEYFYTSKGWTHKPDKHTTASVMFCTGVEDNSAAVVQQLLGQTPRNSNESILDRFFRDCLPKNQHRLPDTVIPHAIRIFDWPFSDELSKSTVSLRWTSKLNPPRVQSALKNSIFGAVHQRPEANPGISDLDSGVSSASQTSKPSLNDLNDGDRFSIITPGEDYSSTGSVTSSSSIQLGWDYLSWNDSLQHKQK